MGFDSGHIIFDRQDGVYSTGETIFGKFVFEQKKTKTIGGIHAVFTGLCDVRWMTNNSNQTIIHNFQEDYVRMEHYLLGDDTGEIELPAGQHELHFEFPIPHHCPSSLEGKYGHVRYSIEVNMHKPGISNKNKKVVAVQIWAPLDLNLIPYCREPLELEMVKSFNGCFTSAGACRVTVRTPKGGFCPGDQIPIDLNAINLSSVTIKHLKLAIKKVIIFGAITDPKAINQEERTTLVEIEKGPIRSGATCNWNMIMEVPHIEVPNLEHCSYIKINYFLKVSTKVKGFHKNSEESISFFLGTIPVTAPIN